MAKWITAAIVASLLFLSGLIAGRSVPVANGFVVAPIGKPNPGLTSSEQQSESDSSGEPTSSDDFTSMLFVSHDAPRKSEEVGTIDRTEQIATGGIEHQTAIRNLILQHFPNTEAIVADVWVESYSDMNLDEISFILEQKRRTSSEIEGGISAFSMPSNREQSIDVAIRMLRTNLRSAYSLGFRRMVVFPEAIGDSEIRTPAERCSTPMTVFRSFESGSLIRSPEATHVALSNGNSAMFCLDGNQLTRRGDFRLMQDRRLGIITRSGEMASAESTPLPEGATEIRIAKNGTVHFKDAARETSDAGRIAVCIVSNPADLQTDDGVFFTPSDESSVTMCEDASAYLLTNTLEQSNVDRSYENAVLAYLKSLAESSLE